MSKVIRAVRISGPVVTLGQLEQELYLEKSGGPEERPAVDLAGLFDSRVEGLERQLEAQWRAILEQEREQLQQAARASLEEAQARWRQELEQTSQQRYDEGFQAGVAAKEAEAREAVERMAALHSALEQQRAQVLVEAEQLVVELAVAVARRVINAQVEVDPKVVMRTLRAALEQLGAHSELVFKVHPEDLQLARRFAERWVEKVAQDTAIRVRPAEEVDRGGCLLEGEEENIDARLETQLEALRQALRAAVETEEGNGTQPAV